MAITGKRPRKLRAKYQGKGWATKRADRFRRLMKKLVINKAKEKGVPRQLAKRIQLNGDG